MHLVTIWSAKTFTAWACAETRRSTRLLIVLRLVAGQRRAASYGVLTGPAKASVELARLGARPRLFGASFPCCSAVRNLLLEIIDVSGFLARSTRHPAHFLNELLVGALADDAATNRVEETLVVFPALVRRPQAEVVN